MGFVVSSAGRHCIAFRRFSRPFLFPKKSTAIPELRVLDTCFFSSDGPSDGRKTALVLGSSGATGSSISFQISQSLGAKVIGADVIQIPSSDISRADWELDGFIHLPKDASLEELTLQLTQGVIRHLDKNNPKLDAIVVASGGWTGDPSDTPTDGASEAELEVGAQKYARTVSKMMEMNLNPVVASGYVAQHFTGDDALFIVIGATAALNATPGMLGYGLSKSAAHHVVETIGACTGKSIEMKTVQKQGRKVRRGLSALDTLSVVGILPTKIDTPSNRAAEPNGNFSEWISPMLIAEEVCKWIENPALRPHSGSLVTVKPSKDGKEAIMELAK